jgi:hypothetical protein
MFRKMLLAGTAGFVVVAGAGAAHADDGPRFVFRYSPAVLTMAAADDGGESGEPGVPGDDGDVDGTGSGDDGTGGTGDGDTGGGDGDSGDVEEEEAAPVNGIVIAPRLELQDADGNGYGDAGERVYLRTVIRNVSDREVSGVRVDYRIALGSMTKTAFSDSIVLQPGEESEVASPVYLDAAMVADLASGIQFEAVASLTAADGETWPFEENATAAVVVPFGVYEPVQPEEITLSSVSAAHLDTDGDGYGDRRETVRVSFSARNTGGLPAQGVSFEIAFPEWPTATGYCDRASLPAGSSMSCSADVEISRDDLDGFGPPETVVSLNGRISLVSLNGQYFTAGEHSTALPPISFLVPPVVYAPHLRIVASEGWTFECVTPWSAGFVADHQDMLLSRWDTGSRTVVPAGGNTVAERTFSLQSTWILVSSIDTTTGKASAYKNGMKSGDTRPAIPSAMPQPCGSNGKFDVVSHGDLTAAYPVVFESVEVVNLPL